jgi:micrococcal nuclease
MDSHRPLRSCIFCLALLLSAPTVVWSLEVVGVTDGDTILVLRENHRIKIHLYGVDAPETQQAYGKLARDFTADLTAGKEIEVKEVARDADNQIVALVGSGDLNLNEELIRSGYAWIDTRSCDRPVCQQWQALEDEAKKEQKGLWRDTNPVPPWEWRKDPQNIVANFLKYMWTILSLRAVR